MAQDQETKDQQTKDLDRSNIRRKQWLTGLGSLFLVIGLIILIYWLFTGRFYEYTDDAYVAGNLVQVMPEITGQVITIYADETDLVKKGQPLVKLDNANAEVALKQAEAQLALTVRQVSQLYTNIGEQQANIQVQEDSLEKAKEDYDRRKGLVVNQTISEEDLQHAKIAKDSATHTLALAKKQLVTSISLVENTDLYNHPQVREAAANLRAAYLTWARTTIYASDTGYVAKRPVQVGQQVDPNTVLMIIAPLNQLWINANYKESQLSDIRIGQPAEIITDAYGSGIKYKGTVIGLSPGTGSSFDLLPPQNATGNWIKIVQRVPVRISIDPNQLEKYPLRIGLSVETEIDTHNRKGQRLTQATQNRIVYQSKDYTSELKQADELIDKIMKENAGNVNYQPPK